MAAFLEVIAGMVIGCTIIALAFFLGTRGGVKSRLPKPRDGSGGETVTGASVPNTFGE